ncbi:MULTISPECIES: polysaccharide lyase family 1 protein [unclassified Massilia]|uniref:pectate lyase family protein n=1 Tax=unclassified Massilia TaxID=2609279 RepID=UPI00177FDC1A|nr:MULTISPECIES: pectate lyase [unclassified Massilia]MBD8531022.1 pectate lyase [Massilia sp. CFBP 13647]MBD8674722.1 pectate lyase [Massilia sp. CFBP 13721]
MRNSLRLGALALACSCLHAQAAAPSTPFTDPGPLSRAGIDAKGWADTTGGAGGKIIRVTNLNAAGAGSFADAVAETGPRIVVFEVGGVIDLQGASIRIREPHLTIAGQTAPDPGITVIRGEFGVATHDVIVQHIAVRPGEFGRAKKSGWNADGLSTSAADNVIVDHCSFSWATDENLSASGPRFNGAGVEEWRQATSRRITFSHNIVAEGLRDSTHNKGEHSKGTLVHDNANRVLIYGNLYNANHERNPLVKGGAHVAVVNNLIHDFGARAIHYNLIAHEWDTHAPQPGIVTLVGNVARGGVDTLPGVPLFSLGGAGDVNLYLRDNLAVDAHGKPLPQTGSYTTSGARIVEARTPYLPPNLKPLPSARLETAIYMSAGMRPWKRDPIDFKIISDVAEGRGLIVDSEAQSSGYPNYAATRRAFDPAAWNLADMSPKAGWDSLFR